MMAAPAATGPRIETLSLCDVWTALGGGPLRAGRGLAFWRDGDGLSVSLQSDKRAWFDHVTATGGGILALVETVLGCDRRAALEWLADNFGIATTERTPEERRAYARRLAQARVAASELVERRDEAFDGIRDRKRELLGRYHVLNRTAHEAEDIAILAEAETVWAQLEALDVEGDALLSETDSAKLAAMLAERGAA